MHRKKFIKSIIGLASMTTLGSFKTVFDNLEEQDEIMPALFVGHGNPMNALEDNEFSRGWRKVASSISKPKAILMISAHWETKGTFITAMENPKTIHDFGGFPKELFDTQYPAQGSDWLVGETKKVILPSEVNSNYDWGFDHGCWSVLKQMYPEATIPVVQLSLDATQDAQYHYDLGKKLYDLRKKGVLIIGSGNMVHNFKYAQIKDGDFNTHFGHDWAIEANEDFKKLITQNDVKSLINYKTYSKALKLSSPTPEHYLPMLYTIALRSEKDDLSFFNDALIGGSFSMTSVKIG
jgi:4,5-DOPA dioxygenase extradiol